MNGASGVWLTITKLPIIGNVRIGNQNTMTGLEHITSDRWLNFMERSFLNDAFFSPFNNGYAPGILVFDNAFENNRSAHVLITAYSLPFTDAAYNPLPRDVVIRNNTYSGGGDDPQGILTPLAEALGGALPPIVWDGVSTWPGATEVQTVNLTIAEAPEVGFLNFGIPSYPLDPATLAPSPDRPASTPPAEPAAIVLAHVKE